MQNNTDTIRAWSEIWLEEQPWQNTSGRGPFLFSTDKLSQTCENSAVRTAGFNNYLGWFGSSVRCTTAWKSNAICLPDWLQMIYKLCPNLLFSVNLWTAEQGSPSCIFHKLPVSFVHKSIWKRWIVGEIMTVLSLFSLKHFVHRAAAVEMFSYHVLETNMRNGPMHAAVLFSLIETVCLFYP